MSAERIAPALTLYFDGSCPFCAAEMKRLGDWDSNSRLAFTDISLPGFDPAHLNATMRDLDLQLYSRTASGRVLVGTASMLEAYTLVGKGWMVWPLRVPLLRGALSFLYRLFARNRYAMSRLLGYKPVCADGVCQPLNPFFRDRKQP
jgi:predicted DCC family thiol-disulfide oxidoreductase YuxK